MTIPRYAGPRYAGATYLDWPEVVTHLEALAEEAPEWTKLESIGRSREGRELWLLTIGEQSGAPDERPGFWLDGGTHAAEWTGVMSALFNASRWVSALEQGDEPSCAWFREHTVYVMVCMSPDAYVGMRDGAPFIRSTMRGPRDGRLRVGLDPHDLDGDGCVRWMRWRDPGGTWVFDDPDNVAKMRRRTIDDDPADAYFVADEGTFLAWDGVRWLEASRELGLDLNRNFPASWTPFEMFGMDSGDYPLSEPESRAVVEAFRARPRIACAVSNHTYTGCLLVSPYRDPSPLPAGDIDMMESLAKDAVVGTDYAVYKVVPDFSYDPKRAIVGVWADAMTSTFGVAGFTLELWNPYGFAGQKVDKPAEFFKNPDPVVLGAMLDAFAEEEGAIHPWQPFDHPQLGAVELGGIEYMTTVRNPPERLLADECERGFSVADRVRRAVPRVRAQAKTSSLGQGLTKIELAVENLGFLPTSGLRHAEAIGVAPPLQATIGGLEVVEGQVTQPLGWLDGWGAMQVGAARHPIYPGLPMARGHRARAAWVVHGTGDVTIRWDAGRGGRGELELTVSSS